LESVFKQGIGEARMISKLWGAVFAAKYPKGYTGRHRVGTAVSEAASVVEPAN
jgi:hypothetical protein